MHASTPHAASRGTSQVLRRSTCALLALGLLLTPLACKDEQQCNEALETARKALQDQYLDLKLARQWREHAAKVCGVGEQLEALDKDILAKEEAIAKAAKEKAEQEAENGKKAMEAAGKIWAAYAKLEDEKQTKKRLKKTRDKVKKMTKALAEEYAKQVNSFNDAQYKKHKRALDD